MWKDKLFHRGKKNPVTLSAHSYLHFEHDSQQFVLSLLFLTITLYGSYYTHFMTGEAETCKVSCISLLVLL